MTLVTSQALPQSPPASPPYHVAVFTPTTRDNTYWPEVHRIMDAAADALDLRLTFHEFDVGDRFAKPDAGPQILETERPDAAIFSVSFGQAEPLMDAAEALDIPFFVSGPLFAVELARIGGSPRQSYLNWVGYFEEDEEEKGYLLARELIAAAVKRGAVAPDGSVHVVGLGGDTTWYGSALREQGLRRAVAEDPAARLLQTVPTRWTPADGRDMTLRLLQRYPDATVVWAASDQLAMGAAEALRTLDREPGVTAFTGGLDLSRAGLQGVQEGVLTATVGGPPLVWAQVLVLLYDYLCGHDFDHLVGTQIVFTPEVADRSSVDELVRMREEYEAVDHRGLSRCHGGEFAWPGSVRQLRP